MSDHLASSLRSIPDPSEVDLADLRSRGEVDERRLRLELAIRAVELADRFDSMDHRVSADGRGTQLQDDCRELREWARALVARDEATDAV